VFSWVVIPLRIYCEGLGYFPAFTNNPLVHEHIALEYWANPPGIHTAVTFTGVDIASHDASAGLFAFYDIVQDHGFFLWGTIGPRFRVFSTESKKD
jgi:hypothetical protein